jgi:hypothetical protein
MSAVGLLLIMEDKNVEVVFTCGGFFFGNLLEAIVCDD